MKLKIVFTYSWKFQLISDYEYGICEGQIGARIKVYLILSFFITVFSRESADKDLIRAKWFEGYKSIHDVYANSEIYLNIPCWVVCFGDH